MGLYMSKNIKKLLSLPPNQNYYISLKWRHDKDRRDLHKLKKLGYFKQISKFVFVRTELKP